MDKAILMQQKVRQNADNFQSYMSDLKQWEQEMKKKESELTGVPLEQDLPPVRSKVKKSKLTPKVRPESRISGSDYKSWDKFDVDKACEMVDEEDTGPTSQDAKLSQKDKEAKLSEEALYEKEQGNKFVKLLKWNEAIKCYSRAIELNNKDPIFYANRAQCHLRKDSLHAAIADCTQALQLDPTYVKAYLRRSLAREKLGSLRGASEDLHEVIKLEPKNASAKKQLDILKKRMGSKGSKSKSSPATTPTVEQPPKTFTSLVPSPKIIELPDEENNNKPITIPTKEEIKTITKPKPVNDIKPKLANPEDTWKDGSGDGVTIINPVTKQPHLRSKKPLRQIEIVEIPIGTSGPHNKDNVKPPTRLKIEEFEEISPDKLKGHGDFAPTNTENNKDIIKNTPNDKSKLSSEEFNVDIAYPQPRMDTPTESMKLKKESCSKEKTNSPKSVINNNIFEIPTSSVQFISQWKSMKGKLDKKSAFLSAINANAIPKIFRNSLESDLLSEILSTIREGYDFVDTKEVLVLPYLQGLTQVPRFNVLAMFLSPQDKKVVLELLEHCKSEENTDENTINLLKLKFEV